MRTTTFSVLVAAGLAIPARTGADFAAFGLGVSTAMGAAAGVTCGLVGVALVVGLAVATAFGGGAALDADAVVGATVVFFGKAPALGDFETAGAFAAGVLALRVTWADALTRVTAGLRWPVGAFAGGAALRAAGFFTAARPALAPFAAATGFAALRVTVLASDFAGAAALRAGAFLATGLAAGLRATAFLVVALAAGVFLAAVFAAAGREATAFFAVGFFFAAGLVFATGLRAAGVGRLP